jgi:hypothetical protein
MSHETQELYLLKYLVIPQDNNAGQVRPRGIGICSRVSDESFSSVSIADQEALFGWGQNCNFFRCRPGPIWASLEDSVSLA